MRRELPKTWVYARLDQVADVFAGNPAPQGHEYFEGGKHNFVRVHDMGVNRNRTYLDKTRDLVNDKAVAKLRLFPSGSVLFTKSGASTLLNQRAILSKESYIVSHIAAAIPVDGIESKWLFYFLNMTDFATLAHATNMPSLPVSRAKSIEIPLAPEAEQRRIVAKIEELFSELDKGIESLKTTREQLKIYRQAVLKHAFEGKLTAQWREENKDKLETPEQLLARINQERDVAYQQQLEEWKVSVKEWERIGNASKKPAKPRRIKKLQPFDPEELGKLPKIESASWKWVKIDKICTHTQNSIKAGPFGSALKKQFYVPDGYKVYGQEQVISGDPYYGNYFVDTAKFKELEACKIAPKDILISLVGTVGKVLILPDNCREGIINPRLVKITLNSNFYKPDFFKYFFESAFVRSLYKTLAKGTTMDVLNLGVIQNLPFPLCSLAEQDKLVAEIESKFSVVDQIEKETEAELEKIETLRLSILNTAFSGNLVAQIPHDEPASVLLARIKAVKNVGKARAQT